MKSSVQWSRSPPCHHYGAFLSSTYRECIFLLCTPLRLGNAHQVSVSSSSLVTLAVQNSLLTIIMHYSRVSTSPSRAYSAATAVLLNELLKGSISLVIAFSRIDRAVGASENSFDPPSPWSPRVFLARSRALAKELFSRDCWKLSIPAILYGPCF